MYATFKEFKDTENEIKQLELLDMKESNTLRETFYKTNNLPHCSMDQTQEVDGKVMLEDGFKVLIKN